MADVITCSYSLSMTDDWAGAIATAHRLLRPGGAFGAVDFYVSAARAAPRRQHGMFARRLWPWWFRRAGVYLHAGHLPLLCDRFEALIVEERAAPLPYVPWARVPYYLFVGRR
jgi:S-adenosylmethionine-diacylgycerolhomoserine-N-methlytransferase